MTRRVDVEILLNGSSVTKYISPYLKSLTYSEILSEEANTAQIDVHDVNLIWRSDWFPKRGDSCAFMLVRQNWNSEGEREVFHAGGFEIDEIDYDSGSSGNQAKIKAVSIPNRAELRNTNQSRSWENVTLKKISQDIADDTGMTLFYKAEEEIKIERAEQSEQSNLSFLQKICRDHYLILQVANNQLIIVDEKQLEQQEPVMTLTYGESAIKRFSAKATISKIYKSCQVVYKNGKKSESIQAEFTDPTKSDGLVLKINKKVSSQAEAERLARNELRQKNKNEFKISLSMIGTFSLRAGNVINLEGYGEFDGKYLLDKINHKIGNSGYTVDVEAHKCLSF